MSAQTDRFPLLSRLLHWTMAVLVLAMLFIGIGMVSTTSSSYFRLLSIHKSIGIIILVLVAIRLINRLLNPPPPLPADLPAWQQLMAKASHLLLYALMFALPIVGWAMLSAGGYPIIIFGGLHLPAILPHDAGSFAVLRTAHTLLALLLFATFLAHLGAALFHYLIRRDTVLQSMA
ncbi:cytochrome b [soil metagenome]